MHVNNSFSKTKNRFTLQIQRAFIYNMCDLVFRVKTTLYHVQICKFIFVRAYSVIFIWKIESHTYEGIFYILKIANPTDFL